MGPDHAHVTRLDKYVISGFKYLAILYLYFYIFGAFLLNMSLQNGNTNLHTIYTDRLILRLADPNHDRDCSRILEVIRDPEGGKGGMSKTGMNSIDDVRYKHEAHGPRPQDCPLAPTLRGMFMLVFVRDSTNPDEEGEFVGMNSVAFRREMPFPDMGWAITGPHQGRGYATEAGRAALKFWTEVIGVREICAMTLESNTKSQRLAEKIGFVRAGTVDVYLGREDEEKMLGRGFVLPGMQWRDGLWVRGTTARPEGWKWKA